MHVTVDGLIYGWHLISDAPLRHAETAESEFGDEESLAGSTVHLVRVSSSRGLGSQPDSRVEPLTQTWDLSPQARATLPNGNRANGGGGHRLPPLPPVSHLPALSSHPGINLPPLPTLHAQSDVPGDQGAFGSQVSGSAFGSQVSGSAFGSQVSEGAFGSQIELVPSDARRSGKARGGIADVSIA
jgi:hypothetical protein